MSQLLVTAPPGGWPPPWPLVTELSDQLPRGSWVLVGGLMVQLHARAAGVEDLRPTADVDMLVDVLAGQASVATIVAALKSGGFEVVQPGWPGAPAHRLRRGDETIDLLVADHLPRGRSPQLLRRAVMAIDGGAQALTRVLTAVIAQGDRSVELRVPDLLGALVLKAAAHAVDSRTGIGTCVTPHCWHRSSPTTPRSSRACAALTANASADCAQPSPIP